MALTTAQVSSAALAEYIIQADAGYAGALANNANAAANNVLNIQSAAQAYLVTADARQPYFYSVVDNGASFTSTTAGLASLSLGRISYALTNTNGVYGLSTGERQGRLQSDTSIHQWESCNGRLGPVL